MLIASLIKAQAEFTEVKKSKKSNFGEYSTTQDILEAVQPALGKYGLKLIGGIEVLPSGHELIFAELLHINGESKRSICLMRDGVLQDKDWGGAFTFRLRHMYKNILGLVTSDYDDNDEGEQVQRAPSTFTPNRSNWSSVPLNNPKISEEQLTQLSTLSAISQENIRTFNKISHLKDLTKLQYAGVVKTFKLVAID